MHVYIAGPMRGYDHYNFPAFDAARDLLWSLGHDPVSPADMDRDVGITEDSELPEGFTQTALRRDFAAVLMCDAVAFLPGWEASSGARAERNVAESIGLPCYRVIPESRQFYRESLIGISGYARVGKDTLASFIVGHGYEQRSFAAPLKQMLYDLNPTVRLGRDARDACTGDYIYATIQEIVDSVGWEGAKTDTEVRQLLQRLGTDAGRKNLGENVWVDALLNAPSAGRVVVADCRFPNEAQAIRDDGGIVIRLTRPGFGPVNAHVSETALDTFWFDCVVQNNGAIGDLGTAADRIVGNAWAL